MTTTAPRIARIAALTGGAAWLADTVGITLNDGAFGVPDDVLYLVGLFSLVVAAGAAGYAWRRAPGLVAGVILAAVAATAIEAGVQGLADAIYSGTNAGLNGEIGLMACGAIAVALAVFVTSGDRGPSS